MTLWIGLILAGLGLAVLFAGKRMWLLGAGVGALLGVGFLRLLPGQQDGVLALLIIFGLAIAVGLAMVFVKGLAGLVALGIGFLAGGAITLGILDALSITTGLIDFILASVGGVIGALVVKRFYNWAIIILAALVGALLMVRGIQLFLGRGGADTIAMGIATVALAGASIWYQVRLK